MCMWTNQVQINLWSPNQRSSKIIMRQRKIRKLCELLLISFGYFLHKSFRFWKKSPFENSMFIEQHHQDDGLLEVIVCSPRIFKSRFLSKLKVSILVLPKINCKIFQTSSIAWFCSFFGLKIKNCFELGMFTYTPRSLNGSLLLTSMCFIPLKHEKHFKSSQQTLGFLRVQQPLHLQTKRKKKTLKD